MTEGSVMSQSRLAVMADGSVMSCLGSAMMAGDVLVGVNSDG